MDLQYTGMSSEAIYGPAGYGYELRGNICTCMNGYGLRGSMWTCSVMCSGNYLHTNSSISE